MLTISESAMQALVEASIERLEAMVAAELAARGAAPETAELCASHAIEVGEEYGITDLESLIGIGMLLGTHSATFDEVPSVRAALDNRRVPPSQRVAKILGSPRLLARIAATTEPGTDPRLRA